MSDEQRERTCANCAAWRFIREKIPSGSEAAPIKCGECRKSPSKAGAAFDEKWPIMFEFDWYLQWQAKDAEPRVYGKEYRVQLRAWDYDKDEGILCFLDDDPAPEEGE